MKKFSFLLIVLLSSCSTIKNLYYSVKSEKLNLTGRELIYSNDCKSLNDFNIQEGFYNDNPVWFTDSTISLINEGIKIECIKDEKYHTAWNGTRLTKWTSGSIDTRNKVEISNGLWIIEARLSENFPAIWLVKHERHVPEIIKETIIPEVDIIENIHDKFRSTVHWGYSDPLYRKYETGLNIRKSDTLFHKFAVDLKPEGYDFL